MSIIEFKGKPVEKLIEVISSGIGVLYTPRKIRTEARAEAERNLTLAKARAEEMLIMNDAENELASRAGQRIIHQELSRQKNIEDIADKVLEYLGDSTSETPLEKDWKDRFFTKAQDVSNEELQEIWAKILAEELTSPGSTRLKTLDVLSNLSKIEASYFNTACSLVLEDGILIELKLDELGNRYYGMSYGQILVLVEAGLIHQGSLSMTYHFIEFLNSCMLRFGKMAILCKIGNGNHLQLSHLSFTNAGVELMHALKPEKNEQHINEIVESLKNKGVETRVSASNALTPFI